MGQVLTRQKDHPLYETWRGMIKRCYDITNASYEHYGRRGVSVHPYYRWSFENFVNDLGLKPTPDHSLDRIDNNKYYEPGNLRWALPSEQQKNRRAFSFINLTDEDRAVIREAKYSQAELARRYKVSRKTIYNIQKGLVKL